VTQHPVAAFIQAWDRLHMSSRMRRVTSKPSEVSLEEFLETYDLESQQQLMARALRLSMPDFDPAPDDDFDDYCGYKRIVNVLWCRFGFDPDESLTKRETLKAFRGYVINDFQMPLLAEHMEESLVLLRQTICWRTEDFVYINKELWESAQLPKDIENSPLFDKISALIPMDMVGLALCIVSKAFMRVGSHLKVALTSCRPSTAT